MRNLHIPGQTLTSNITKVQFKKMLRHNLSKLLNIVLIISCVVHIMFLFYNNSNPKLPEIIMTNKNIRDVEMPLSFLVCLTIKNPELKNKNFNDAGYSNIQQFFTGSSMHNDSIFGWFGHMKNGSPYNSLEGVYK